MKKFCFLVVLFLFFFSCTKENGDTQIIQQAPLSIDNSLCGVWTLTYFDPEFNSRWDYLFFFNNGIYSATNKESEIISSGPWYTTDGYINLDGFVCSYAIVSSTNFETGSPITELELKPIEGFLWAKWQKIE